MDESNTLLHPPWLNVARALWLAVAIFCIVIGVVGTLEYVNAPLPNCSDANAISDACGPWVVTRQDLALAQELGLSTNLIFWALAFQSVFPKVCYAVVAFIIFWRKSEDWVALLLSIMLIGFAIEGVTNVGTLTPLAQFVYLIITGIFVLLPFIFPNGRFVPRRIRWLALFVMACNISASLLPYIGISTTDQIYILALMISFALWFLVAGYSAVYRYMRVSNPLERQQTKWVVAGILGTFLLFIPFTIIGIWFPPSQPSPERLAFMFLVFVPVYFIAYLFMPIAIAIAILRYRLWDIDLLIRRTVTYTIVAAMLAAVYFGSVILLQQLFAAVTGQREEFITVLSTLAIAALFVPLRNRVQNAIDKRFNRKKYDAQQVLQKFAQTVRDETDLDKLNAELLNVVNETMQPKNVSLWLKKDGSK